MKDEHYVTTLYRLVLHKKLTEKSKENLYKSINRSSKIRSVTDAVVTLCQGGFYDPPVKIDIPNIEEIPEPFNGDGSRCVVVCSQFLRSLELIATNIELMYQTKKLKRRIDILFYHGGLNEEERKAIIEKAHKSTTPTVFLLSFHAGKVGLNLHFSEENETIDSKCEDSEKSQQLILVEPWWTRRIHRITQTRPCFIHSFVTKDTVESHCLDLQVQKEYQKNLAFEKTENLSKLEPVKWSLRSACENLINLHLKMDGNFVFGCVYDIQNSKTIEKEKSETPETPETPDTLETPEIVETEKETNVEWNENQELRENSLEKSAFSKLYSFISKRIF